MRRSHYLLSFILSRLVFLIVEVVRWLASGGCCSVCGARILRDAAGITILGSFSSPDWAPGGESRKDDRRCLGTDESRDAADVDSVGTFFSYARFPMP